ncbi:MAG TPA: porin [Burkholderiaceae bacterium]|nr:porin [Burkholderiaceae bacterium]
MVQKTAVCAAAGLLAMLCGAAHAQSNVTIYGLLDVFLEYGKANAHAFREQSGGLNGSRLGFKGTEDLGGGLKANFVLEHGLLVDSGGLHDSSGKSFWNRQIHVGLSDSWGSVSMGRQYSPLIVQQDTFDPAPNTTGYGSAYNSGVLRTLSRVNNSVVYKSPSIGGFEGSLMYGLGENTLGTRYGAVLSGSAKYAAGPFAAGLAFLQQGKGDATQEDKSIWNLAGSYQIGDFQLLGALQRTRNDSQKANTVDDRNEFLLGGVYNFGANQIRASWGQAKVKDASDSTVRHVSVGFIHNLSKRTSLYAIAQEIHNPKNLAYRASGYSFDAVENGLPANAGVNAQAIGFGIRHRF